MNCDRYDSDFTPQWCPGCGNFAILDGVKEALCDLYEPRQVILVAGIGQASKLGFSVRTNMFNGLHGRTLPLAMGMHMANHQAKILVVAGDGDLFAEGGNHFIHAMRRNMDITILAGDNRVYGLTKGQGAPTSALDFRLHLHKGGEAPQPAVLRKQLLHRVGEDAQLAAHDLLAGRAVEVVDEAGPIRPVAAEGQRPDAAPLAVGQLSDEGVGHAQRLAQRRGEGAEERLEGIADFL